MDQQAALLAQNALEPGQAKCTYGTGAFLLAQTGSRPSTGSTGLVSCVAWRLGGRTAYCLDGQVYTAASAVRWLTDLGVISGAADLDPVGASVPDTGGVTFVPALAGLAAPWWRSDLRGSVTGLGLDTTAGHLVRALCEGIAAQVVALADAVASDLGAPLTTLRVDGGLTRSSLLMQTQADLLQRPVEVSALPDATALGAGVVARLGLDPDLPRAAPHPRGSPRACTNHGSAPRRRRSASRASGPPWTACWSARDRHPHHNPAPCPRSTTRRARTTSPSSARASWERPSPANWHATGCAPP